MSTGKEESGEVAYIIFVLCRMRNGGRPYREFRATHSSGIVAEIPNGVVAELENRVLRRSAVWVVRRGVCRCGICHVVDDSVSVNILRFMRYHGGRGVPYCEE